MKDLLTVQAHIRRCRLCPKMIGPPVHGSASYSPILLIGQAPGPHEGERGKPFAHTAGITLFKWFGSVSGIDETSFRERIYMAAVARCYPGKGKGAGDRVPDATEISNCSRHLKNEINILKPTLILPIGKLAIQQALGEERFGSAHRLVDVIGNSYQVNYLGHVADAICLPHPSGLSSWHKTEPGKTLLQKALKLVIAHPAWHEAVY